jgi:hypothetical protein
MRAAFEERANFRCTILSTAVSQFRETQAGGLQFLAIPEQKTSDLI